VETSNISLLQVAVVAQRVVAARVDTERQPDSQLRQRRILSPLGMAGRALQSERHTIPAPMERTVFLTPSLPQVVAVAEVM
jgi:hypothetical protein